LGILWDLIGFNGNIMGPSPPTLWAWESYVKR
jgi:hypothetical protein